MTGGPHLGALVVNSSTPLWYTTRATGLVALVLLTGSMALGLLSWIGVDRRTWPRFVTLAMHRNVALLAITFTIVHVLTTVLDSFVSIPLPDAFIPFISSYRPFWIGLGAISFDLMIALIVTSLIRARLGQRSWRLVHWTSYACWPVAVVHGLGSGTDTRLRWVLLLTACCVLVVVGLTLWRLALSWPYRPLASVTGVVVLVLTIVVVGAWLKVGPLSPGWSHRSGTHTTKPAGPAAARGALR